MPTSILDEIRRLEKQINDARLTCDANAGDEALYFLTEMLKLLHEFIEQGELARHSED